MENSTEYIKDLIKRYFPEDKIIRAEQEDVLIQASQAFLSGKHHFIAELPTGVGKSLVALTFAKMINALNKNYVRTTISTKTKALQDQYVNDFPFIDTIKAPGNYPCSSNNITPLQKKDTHCGDYFCKKSVKKDKSCKDSCEYLIKKAKYWNSHIRITNNALLLLNNSRECKPFASCTYPQDLPEYARRLSPLKEIIIIDECHQMYHDIISTGTLELNTVELDNMLNNLRGEDIGVEGLGKSLKDIISTFTTNPKPCFVNTAVTRNLESELGAILGIIREKMKDLDSLVLSFLSRKIESMLKIVGFMSESSGKYICYPIINKPDKYNNNTKSITYHFAPIEANAVIKNLLIRGNFFLHLSATIGDVDAYAKELGIDNYESYTCDSPFPLANRPIYYTPCTNFSYNNQEQAIKDVARIIDVMINSNPGRRMVIHTSSYYYAEQIKSACVNNFNMIIPRNSKDLNKYIDTMSTLIGPTLYEGVDFYDDRVRINVLTKLQFPSLADPYIETKKNYVRGWYEKETLNKFIQSYGRGVRHKDDQATFIILDSNFSRYINSKYIPQWVKEAIIQK